MKTVLCSSLENLVDKIRDHRCFHDPAPWQGPGQSGSQRDREFFATDDPIRRTLGYLCPGCETRFEITLSDIRKSQPDRSWLETFRTTDGRVRLASLFSDKK